MSAVLLPFRDGSVDWQAWEAHLTRTAAAGLVPAVNMDTGYVHLLDDRIRGEVVRRTATVMAGTEFVVGAYVNDGPGDPLALDAHVRVCSAIAEAGGTPIVFPAYGLGGNEVEAYAAIGRAVDRFLGFELGPMFHPAGRIFEIETYTELLRSVPALVGAKHSSLSRSLEWERLQVRDVERPDFLVLTGNDLAIDMVMYGSDYLLGLSTFDPDAFAARDALWAKGDARFFELNDALQALGSFAFRDPVPAYRHDAALYLALRGSVAADAVHPAAPRRDHVDAEIDVLRTFADRIEAARQATG